MRRSAILIAFALLISSFAGLVGPSAAYADSVAPPAPQSSIAKPFPDQKFVLTGNIGTAVERPVKIQRWFSKWETDKDPASSTTTEADGSYTFTTSTSAAKRHFRIIAPKVPATLTTPELPEVISLVKTIYTQKDTVKLVLTRNRSTGFAVGTLGAPTDGRQWALQVKSGSKWNPVGAKVAEADGQITIPFPLGAHTYRLVGDPIPGSNGVTSNTQTSVSGPKNLGPHVMFASTDNGATPTNKGVDHTGAVRIDNDEPLALETIAVRGHSSVKYPKKSFKVKFIDQQTPVGLPKGKTFALLPNYQDHSLVRTAVGIGAVASQLDGMGWQPHRAFTELFINGKYRGSYELIETLKIQNKSKKNDPRLEIDAEKGVIIEINPSDKGATPGYFTASKSKLHIGLKDPDETTKEDDGSLDPEGVTPEKVKQMQAKVKKFESVLYSKDYKNKTTGWTKYMDMDSAVDFYLEKEFIKDWDGDFQASTFFYDPDVTDPNVKLKMGPTWDVDRSAGVKTSGPNYVKTPTGWWMNGDPGKVESRDYHTTHWFTRIAKDSAFQTALRHRWDEKYGVFKAAGNTAVDQAVTELSKTAAANDRAMWQGSQPTGRYKPRAKTYDGEISIVKKWYKDRYKWMNSKIGSN